MEMKAKASVRNKFIIEVRDSLTGELKKSSEAYNTVTEEYIIRMASSTSSVSNVFSYIHVGSGQGEPSYGNTTLFKREAGYEAVRGAITYEGDNVWSRLMSVRLPANVLVGVSITEIGLARAIPGNVLTHAMITDSEGAVISIDKTDTDIIDIYATVYCTLEDISDKGMVWAKANNVIVNRALGGSALSSSTQLYNFIYGDKVGETFTSRTNTTAMQQEGSKAVATFTAVFDEGSANGLRMGFGISNMFDGVLPLEGSWEGMDVSKTVSLGDGVTREYSLPDHAFEEGTLEVKVDGSPVTPTYISNALIHHSRLPSRWFGDVRYSLIERLGEDKMLIGYSNRFYVADLDLVNLTIEHSEPLTDDVFNWASTSPDQKLIALIPTRSSLPQFYDLEGSTLGDQYVMQPGLEAILSGMYMDSYYSVIFTGDDRGVLVDGIQYSGRVGLVSFSIDRVNKTLGDVTHTLAMPNGTMGAAFLHGRLYVAHSSLGMVRVGYEPVTGVFGDIGDGVPLSATVSSVDRRHILSNDSGTRLSFLGSVYDMDAEGSLSNETTGNGRVVAHLGDDLLLTSGESLVKLIRREGSHPTLTDTGLISQIIEATAGAVVLSDDLYVVSYRTGYPYSGGYYFGRVSGNDVVHFILPMPPASGATVTADYTAVGIPKDENHILTVKTTLEITPG